jgi:hypothetical protein
MARFPHLVWREMPTSPKSKIFEFSPAAGAKKIEQVQADEIGELMGEEQQ